MPDTEELPDWDTITGDREFINLPADEQAAVLDGWSQYVGGRLKDAGATTDQAGDFDAFVSDARSVIKYSSDTRRTVQDLNDRAAFTGADPFTGQISEADQVRLSAPMMGSEMLAAMGIPDVWGHLQEKRKAKDEFDQQRKQLVSDVGDEKLGDMIISREQEKYRLEASLADATKRQAELISTLEKEPDNRDAKDEERELGVTIETLAQQLGHRGEASQDSPIRAWDKTIEERRADLAKANNGVAPETSAASSFAATWAKTALESAPVRFTSWLFDKIYGGGEQGMEGAREDLLKRQSQILEGRVPQGMSRAFVNPSLSHDAPQQLARGLGHMMDWKTPMIFGGTAGLAAFGVAGAEQSYEEAAASTLAAGGSKGEANTAGWTAAAWTLPTLAAYMGVGKAVAAASKELLPLAATPLARASVALPANIAGNVAASGSLRWIQGGEFLGKDWIEEAVPDVLFALHAATDAYGSQAKVNELTPTMQAVAAGTHPDIILRRAVAESPAFPDEARTIARTELVAQQTAARQFLENAGIEAPKEVELGDTNEAAQAQTRMMELAAERVQIMRRLNDPAEAPEPGGVARLPDIETEMKGLVSDALTRAGAPSAAVPAPEAAPPKEPAAPPAAPPAAVPAAEEPPAPAPAPEPKPRPAPVDTPPPPDGFEETRSRLTQQLDDATADLEWARNSGDPAEIASAEAAADMARQQWTATFGQEGRGNLAENVSEKIGAGTHEWTGTGLREIAPQEPAPPAPPAKTAEVAQEGAPAAPQERPAPAKAKIKKGFSIPYAPLGVPDMIDFVVEQGGLKLPKKADRKQEHDDVPLLPGVYRRLATTSGKIHPDEMAQMLYEAGLIREPHVPTMWAELGRAADSRMRLREQEQSRSANEKAQIKQHEQQQATFERDASKPAKGAEPVNVESLHVGDSVEVGGESMKVTEVDDSGNVTLEDGKKYGIQVVRDGEVIYGEHMPAEQSGDFLSEGDAGDFTLESASDTQLKAETEQQRQRDAIRDGQARRLEGTAGDTTSDMFGEGETPLFNERRDVPAAPAEDAPRRFTIGEAGPRREQTQEEHTLVDLKFRASQGDKEARALYEQKKKQAAAEEPAAPASTAPAAELPGELTADQHLKIEATVRAAADSFTFRNEAEKESAIAQVLSKVEAGAAKFIQGTGSLEHFSAAVLARSRFTDIVRKAEQKSTENPAATSGEEGWTETTRDIPDEAAPSPADQAARADAVSKIVAAFDKFTDKGAAKQDKLAVMKLVERGIDSPTEIAREMGWMTGSGESRRPDATKAVRVLKAASEEILRETKLTREDVFGILPPGMAQMMADVTAGLSAARGIFAKIVAPGDWTNYRESLLTWSMRQQRSATEIQKMLHEAERVTSSSLRREAITNWLEANGDKALLAQREAASKNTRVRKGYQIARALTPEEIAFARKVRSTYDALWNRGAKEGIIRKRRANYVNHIWKKAGLAQQLFSSSRRLSEYFANSRQRTFDTFFDGEQQGFKAETKDIAKLLGVYMSDLNNVVISKHFVKDLMGGKAPDGRPLLRPAGNIQTVQGNGGEKVYLVYPRQLRADAKDYGKSKDGVPQAYQPAMEQWLWHASDAEGNPIIVRDGLMLHPDYVRDFNAVFGRNAMREFLAGGETGELSSIPKRVSKFLIDDLQSVMKQTMLGFFSPFHAVQEGTHAIGHRINPFYGLPRIDLTRYPAQREAASHGLMLAPDRLSKSQFMEGLGGNSRNLATLLLRGIGRGLPDALGGRAVERVARWSDDFQTWLFHQYIPSLKFKTYEAMVERNTRRYSRELAAGEISEDALKYLSATQSNAAYGHLNYADMARSQGFQTFLQAALLAPDFLEARGRFVGQALKGKAGREQLEAVLFLGAVMWGSARVLNKLTDDDWHFDLPFEVVGPPLDLAAKYAYNELTGDKLAAAETHAKMEHSKRSYRMRSVPEDLYALFHDPIKFANGRVSPLIGKGVLQGMSGVNYRGEKVKLKDTAVEITASAIPLTLQPFTREFTKTGRESTVDWWEQLTGSLGLHVSRYSPLVDTYKLASAWTERQTGKEAQEVVYPPSKYSRLRYALEDGDWERAGREWEKLLAGEKGRPPYKVVEGFRASMSKPFTGTKTSDAKFRSSLKGKDLDSYERSVERRKYILRQFTGMHAEWMKARGENEKAAAPE